MTQSTNANQANNQESTQDKLTTVIEKYKELNDKADVVLEKISKRKKAKASKASK